MKKMLFLYIMEYGDVGISFFDMFFAVSILKRSKKSFYI